MSDRMAMHAKEALNNEALKKAFCDCRDAYVKAFQDCTVGDDLGRFRYSVALKTIDAVWRHLEQVVTAGEIQNAMDMATPERRRFKIPGF